MHVIEETEAFTLVGVDAQERLTLFDAEGPRERGSLERIALRVGSADACGIDHAGGRVGSPATVRASRGREGPLAL